MDLKQKVIVSSTPELAARRVCAWVNSSGVKVNLVSISQVISADRIYTTIFWNTMPSGRSVNDSSHKSHPRIGERRLKRQPLKIDKLPTTVHQAICTLRKQGKTWLEISDSSALLFSPNWATDGGGFVEWKSLSEEVLKAFPGKRIPQTNLLRWFDLRIEQRIPLYEKP